MLRQETDPVLAELRDAELLRERFVVLGVSATPNCTRGPILMHGHEQTHPIRQSLLITPHSRPIEQRLLSSTLVSTEVHPEPRATWHEESEACSHCSATFAGRLTLARSQRAFNLGELPFIS